MQAKVYLGLFGNDQDNTKIQTVVVRELESPMASKITHCTLHVDFRGYFYWKLACLCAIKVLEASILFHFIITKQISLEQYERE